MDYGEAMNALTKHHYAEQLLPFVLRARWALGLGTADGDQLMLKVARDKPRALEYVCAARLARRLYRARVAADLFEERAPPSGAASQVLPVPLCATLR